MAKFEVYLDKKEQFRWRLKANNGEIIADSNEGYSSKQGATNGIELVKKHAPAAEVVDLTAS